MINNVWRAFIALPPKNVNIVLKTIASNIKSDCYELVIKDLSFCIGCLDKEMDEQPKENVVVII